jgi:cytoskeletal protein CcmA (bactofilin family)
MTTVIGQNTRIRGRILGATDIEVHGQIEGDLHATGEVVVEAGALVVANVDAARIVVRGAVRGNLNASEALLLEDGARVIGDLRGARIAIAATALVRGYVETAGASGASAPRAVRRAEPVRFAPKPVAAPVRVPVKVVPPPPKSVPVVVAKKVKVAPAPVVPVLKKGTKAVHKSKRA